MVKQYVIYGEPDQLTACIAYALDLRGFPMLKQPEDLGYKDFLGQPWRIILKTVFGNYKKQVIELPAAQEPAPYIDVLKKAGVYWKVQEVEEGTDG